MSSGTSSIPGLKYSWIPIDSASGNLDEVTEIFIPSEGLIFDASGHVQFARHPKVSKIEDCEKISISTQVVEQAKQLYTHRQVLEKESNTFIDMVKHQLNPAQFKQKESTPFYVIESVKILEDRDSIMTVEATGADLSKMKLHGEKRDFAEKVLGKLDASVPYDNLRYDVSTNCILVRIKENNRLELEWLNKTRKDNYFSYAMDQLRDHDDVCIFGLSGRV